LARRRNIQRKRTPDRAGRDGNVQEKSAGGTGCRKVGREGERKYGIRKKKNGVTSLNQGNGGKAWESDERHQKQGKQGAREGRTQPFFEVFEKWGKRKKADDRKDGKNQRGGKKPEKNGKSRSFYRLLVGGGSSYLG